VRADVARHLLPTVRNRNWFFDTELLVQAERAGLGVHELPVDWVDDSDSRVDIATAVEDLRGIWRLATGRFGEAAPRLSGQLLRFAAVGLASTLSYAVLYWLLRETLPGSLSNAIALLVTTVLNTAANRRLTFGVRGSEKLFSDHAGGLAAFAIALLLTTAAMLALRELSPAASRGTEIAVLTGANAVATGARFLILRALFHHLRSHSRRKATWSRLARAFPTRLPLAALVAAVCALLLGPAAYALATVNHPASGALPLAGPAVSDTRTFAPPGGPASGTTPGAARGGALDAQLIGYLERNQGGSTWLVAVPSGMQAASLELSTGKAVLAMGGFNGSDPVPTASQMTQLVASGKLRFVLLGGRGAGLTGGGPGRILGSGSGPPGGIAPAGIAPGAGSPPPSTGGPAGAAGRGTQEAVRWVQANCSPVAGAGVSGLYDCAAAPAGS
jgi:putative flippase GtrA